MKVDKVVMEITNMSISAMFDMVPKPIAVIKDDYDSDDPYPTLQQRLRNLQNN